jgi:hypothetical protein
MTCFELNDSLTLFLYDNGYEYRDRQGREWRDISPFNMRPLEFLENNLTQIITVSEGMRVIEWRNENGQLHRDADRPAKIIETANCVEHQFYQNGVLSRCTDQPAILKKRKRSFHDSDYDAFYYHNGLLHRLNGPAVFKSIWRDLERGYPNKLNVYEFYVHGRRHRGWLQPAIIKYDTQKHWRKEYYRKGKYIDAPFKTLLKISFQKGYLSKLSTVEFREMVYLFPLFL